MSNRLPFDANEISDAEIEGALGKLGAQATATISGPATVTDDDDDFHSVYMPSGIGSVSGEDSFDIPPEAAYAADADSLVLEPFEADIDEVTEAVTTLATGVGVVIDPEVKGRVLAIARSNEPRNLALIGETISKIADRDVVLAILANADVDYEVKKVMFAKNRVVSDEFITEVAAETGDAQMIDLIFERGIDSVGVLKGLFQNSFFLEDDTQVANRAFLETRYGNPISDGLVIIEVLEVLTAGTTIDKVKELCAEKGFYRLGDGLAMFYTEGGQLYMSIPLMNDTLILDSDLDSGLLLEHLQKLVFKSSGKPVKHLKSQMVQILGELNRF